MSIQHQMSRLNKNDATRSEIGRAAIRSFLRNGFDHTTVDDIAVAAGISRRTYFRYFASKDESLLSATQELGILVAEAFRRTPQTAPPLVALRDAFLEVEADLAEFPERQRTIATMLRTNRRVHGALLLVQLEWVDELTELLAIRHGREVQIADRLLAQLAINAWNIAVDRWLEDSSSSLRSVAMDTFDELATLISEPALTLTP